MSVPFSDSWDVRIRMESTVGSAGLCLVCGDLCVRMRRLAYTWSFKLEQVKSSYDIFRVGGVFSVLLLLL